LTGGPGSDLIGLDSPDSSRRLGQDRKLGGHALINLQRDFMATTRRKNRELRPGFRYQREPGLFLDVTIKEEVQWPLGNPIEFGSLPLF
jgi:hypothetical protein